MSRRSERHRTSAKERFTIGCDQLRAKCGVVWYGYACLVCHVCQCTVFPSTSLMHLCILIPVPNRGGSSLRKPSLTTNKKGYHHLRDEIKKNSWIMFGIFGRVSCLLSAPAPSLHGLIDILVGWDSISMRALTNVSINCINKSNSGRSSIGDDIITFTAALANRFSFAGRNATSDGR